MNMSISSRPVHAPMPRIQTRTKKFMNGMGGKLVYKQQSSSDTYKMKVDSGYSMLETWGHALLGQYVGNLPGHHLITDMMNKWNVRATYRVEEGWYIFRFESEEDQEKVLLEGPYFILGRPMLVRRVPDKFSFHRRDVALVPLWVRLHGLGKRYWHPDILSDIGSFIGKPLYMDTVTDERKRSAYARVLVEINLAAPIKKKITLEYDDGESFDCEFFVENQPKFCKCCCSLGHNERECSTLTRKTTVTPAQSSKGVSFAAIVKSSPIARASTSAPVVVATKTALRDPIICPTAVQTVQVGAVNMTDEMSGMRPSSVGHDSVIGKEHILDKSDNVVVALDDTGRQSVATQRDDCGMEERYATEHAQNGYDDDDVGTECSEEDIVGIEKRTEANLDDLAALIPPDELTELVSRLYVKQQKEKHGKKFGGVKKK